MRTSVLIALLAVSFTAVLAAPSHPKISHKSLVSVHKIHSQHNLKKIALPKIAIAPNGGIEDLIELIGLIIGIDIPEIIAQAEVTVQEVEAALNNAAQQLVEATERVDAELALEVEAVINGAIDEALVIIQPLLDTLAPLIPDGKTKHALQAHPNSLIDELIKLLLGVSLEELVAIVEKTVTDLDALVLRTLAQLDEIALRLSQELQEEVDRITAEAEAAIVAAIAPLLELLKPILPPPTTAVAPRVDLPELIALISKALAEIDAAIAAADAALLALLENSPLLPKINAVLEAADAKILATVEAALARALEVPVGELPALVLETVGEIQATINNAAAEVQVIIGDEAPELIAQIREISLALIIQIQDALAPLIDIISPPESHAIAKVPRAVTLPELIELIRVASEEISAAVNAATVELEALLAGTHILDDVIALVVAAEKKALAQVEAAVVEALAAPIGQLPAILETLVADLQVTLTETIAEVQALVAREAGELVQGIEVIVANLAVAVGAAIQPIIDALNPPQKH